MIIMVMVMTIPLKLYPPVWNQVVKEILKSRDMKILVGRFSTPSPSLFEQESELGDSNFAIAIIIVRFIYHYRKSPLSKILLPSKGDDVQGQEVAWLKINTYD